MVTSREVRIAPRGLQGTLSVPSDPTGVILFAHGSGSSHLSPRNVYVAQALQKAHLATLLFDLLTEEEELDRENVFDIDMLAGRLREATEWLRSTEPSLQLPVGYFGASTGAAAALIAAAGDRSIAAVVSRGGRPDLAGNALEWVMAPTILIVGGDDDIVITLNREAYARLRCVKRLSIVPGATHLFEEAGTLDQVVDLATHWFTKYLIGKNKSEMRSGHVQ